MRRERGRGRRLDEGREGEEGDWMKEERDGEGTIDTI